MTKEQYQTNRKAGKRGQGEYPDLVVGIEITPPSGMRGLRARRKNKDRRFTSPAWGRARSIFAGVNKLWLLREARREAAK